MKNRLLLLLLPLLLLLLAPAPAAHAQEDIPLFTTDFPAEEFARRRAAVYDAIGREAVAVLQGAPGPVGFTRFRQSNEFYYLCGVEVPHAYLLLDGESRRTILYLPHRNNSRERSEGKLLSAEDAELVVKLTGVELVVGTDVLAEHLSRYARGMAGRTLWTPLSPAEGLAVSRDMATRTVGDIASDPWDGRPSREGHFVSLVRTRFPQLEVRDLTPALDRLRLIKSPREIALIEKATRLSGLALIESMRSTRGGRKVPTRCGFARARTRPGSSLWLAGLRSPADNSTFDPTPAGPTKAV